MAGRIEPTTEQLQAAWLQRRRDDWPESLAATLAVPLLATIVRSEAVRRCLGERKAQRTAAAWAALRPYAAPVHRPQAPPQARQPLDRKRLAAGERDDD